MTAARTALPLLLTIWEDTRQQRSFKALFEALPGVACVSKTLPEADLTTELLWKIGAIEIKREDFAPAVGSDRERVDKMIDRLRPYRWKGIIVADEFTSICRKTQVRPNAILGSIASWFARFDCPVLFVANDAAAARLAAGILRRWEARLVAEREGGQAA